MVVVNGAVVFVVSGRCHCGCFGVRQSDSGLAFYPFLFDSGRTGRPMFSMC